MIGAAAFIDMILLEKTAQELQGLLLDQGLTISVAESLTAGNLQAAITSVSGASAYFVGGICTYDIDQKVKFLFVNREHAASCNCVSEQVVAEMAQGCKSLFMTDITIATTGYAEPCPDEGWDDPGAYICVHFQGKGYIWHVTYVTPGITRRMVQERVAWDAMTLCCNLLKGEPVT